VTVTVVDEQKKDTLPVQFAIDVWACNAHCIERDWDLAAHGTSVLRNLHA